MTNSPDEELTGWHPGDVVAGRYRLQRELGRGAMGTVWRAVQINLNRAVALKLLLPRYVHEPGARARFEREARVASQLEHPNAVRIHEFGEHEGHLFIAMELLRGGPLRGLAGEDRPLLEIGHVLSLIRPVADALVAAHDIGLVHRDIKPENIFLERRGDAMRVVVVDFGLAFIEAGDRTGRMTREGVTAGTPGYMPPEQAAGEAVGPPADVYALACVLYELLTGYLPFRGSPMQILTQHMFSAVVPASEVRRDLAIPRALDELCSRALAKTPTARPSMEVVRSILMQPNTVTRERGREEASLGVREGRMIGTARLGPTAPTLTDLYATPSGAETIQLAVVGALEGELVVGLGANGFIAYLASDEQSIAGADAIYAPGASPRALVSLLAHGLPILTDTDPDDLTRLTELLRAGVSEVVHRPVHADQLARKIWRAIRRARRNEQP